MKTQNKDIIFQKNILPLREEIDKIDSMIVTLLANRHDQVLKVVQLKKEHNISVYHPAREEDLISRLRIQAEKSGLDPGFLENLYRTILRYSRVRQTDQMKIQGVLSNGRILIIGGYGQMGSFFASVFAKSGYEVRILDESNWHKAEQLCENINLALVSVPIEQTCDVIEQISAFLPLSAVLADLTSVKEQPLAKMLECHKGPVLGLHPLFGPDPGSLDKQVVIITAGRDSKSCQWLIDQLSVSGVVIVKSTASEHDEIMEIVQALRHFATFCFGQFLYQKRIKLEKTLEFSSPIYRLELGMVGRLFAQDASLYSQIIFATKKRRTLLKEYISSLKCHIEMLENNNTKLFIKEFDKISQWFGPFSEQAMRESTFLIDRLIERF